MDNQSREFGGKFMRDLLNRCGDNEDKKRNVGLNLLEQLHTDYIESINLYKTDGQREKDILAGAKLVFVSGY